MAGTHNVGESPDNPVAINVTAMVDVIFCLCIFFMCSFHFKELEGVIDTWLPKEGHSILPAGIDAPFKDEVRVILQWAADKGRTLRKVAHRGFAGTDDELVRDIVEVASAYTRAGNTTWPLVIDSAPEVPWEEVVHVMDLCRMKKIERIEFAGRPLPIQ